MRTGAALSMTFVSMPKKNSGSFTSLPVSGYVTLYSYGEDFELTYAGAIPALAELQAQAWILRLCNRLPKPPNLQDAHFRLREDPDRRIQYAVDHDAYA